MHLYTKKSEVAEKLIDLGILISKEQEQEYADKNKVIFRRNSNGSVLFCAYNITSEYRDVKIEFNLTSGSDNDIKGKEGSHHFLEHLLFSKDFNSKCIVNNVANNASTSEDEIQFYINGNLNSKYPKFGVPGVLNVFIQNFINPTAYLNKELFNLEKQVILKEIDEYNNDFYRQATKKLRELIYNEDSFLLINNLGTKESLNNITQKDISNIINKYINSKNIFTVIGIEAGKKEKDFIIKNVNNEIGSMEYKGISTYNNLIKDPKIKNIEEFNYIESKITNIKNNMCAVGFVSLIEEEIYTNEEYAFHALLLYLNDAYFERIRDKGLVYTGGLNRSSFLNNQNVVYAYGIVHSQKADEIMKQMEREYKILLNELYTSKTILFEFYNKFKIAQLASPINYGTKIKDFYSNYSSFNLLTNSSKYRLLRSSYNKNLLIKAVDKLLSTKRVLYKLGDF